MRLSSQFVGLPTILIWLSLLLKHDDLLLISLQLRTHLLDDLAQLSMLLLDLGGLLLDGSLLHVLSLKLGKHLLQLNLNLHFPFDFFRENLVVIDQLLERIVRSWLRNYIPPVLVRLSIWGLVNLSLLWVGLGLDHLAKLLLLVSHHGVCLFLFLSLLPLGVLSISLLLLQKASFLLLFEERLLLRHILLEIHDVLPENLLIVRVLLHLLRLGRIFRLTLEHLHHLSSLLEVSNLLLNLGLNLSGQLLECLLLLLRS